MTDVRFPPAARIWIAVLCLAGVGCSGSSLGSDVTDALSEVARETAVEDMLESDPPITSSFSDAVTEVEFLDGYRPSTWKPLSVLPRSESNMFRLAPGRYAFQSQSYCLHAGTHGPSGGEGYLWAPLRGSRAGIIRSILRRSVDHPEIPQRQIQTLIWAVLARAEFSEMPPERRAVAAVLLTPEELFELNGGALGLVPDAALDRAVRELPAPARAALRARAELRRLYRDADATYDQLERAAVLTGAAPPEHEVRRVPATRWSYHPDGYFLRYRPNGYRRMGIQMYVPQRFTLERNEAGAIAAVRSAAGHRIELTYEDGEPASPTSAGGAAGGAGRTPTAIRITGVRFERRASMGPEIAFTLEEAWSDVGWTLVGDPTSADPPGAGELTGWAERRRAAIAMTEDLEALERELGVSGRPTRSEVVDLGHLVLALRASLGGRDLSGWRAEQLLMAEEAWAWALCRHLGGCSGAGRPPGQVADGPSGMAPSSRRLATLDASSAAFDPPSGPAAGDPGPGVGAGRAPGAGRTNVLQEEPPSGPDGCAMPANTSAQRLCPSGRNGDASAGGPSAGGEPGADAAGRAGGGGPGDPGGGDPGDAGDGDAGDPGGGDPGAPGDPSDDEPGDGDDDTPPEDIDRPDPDDYDDEEEPDDEQCEAVRDELRDLRTVRETFADRGLLEQAERNDLPGVGDDYSYQDLVKDELRGKFADTGSGEPRAAMGTGPSCEVDAPPRSSYTSNGTPGVIWDAARWHEQVHRENCQATEDWYDGLAEDPAALRDEELEAYDEAIDVLEEYEDARCR